MRRAGGLDDVEMRAAAPAVRRRERRRPLQPARDVARRARAPHAAVHVRAPAVHRPAGGHPRAGHGDERADDGLDDGHLLDAARPRGAGDRDRQADLDRRLRVPPRGDGRRRRDGDRARLRAPRMAPVRAALRRAGLRQRRRHRGAGARRPRRNRDRRLRRLRRRARRRRARHPDDERATPASTARSRAGRRARVSRTRSCSSSSATSSCSRLARTRSTATTPRAFAAG